MTVKQSRDTKALWGESQNHWPFSLQTLLAAVWQKKVTPGKTQNDTCKARKIFRPCYWMAIVQDDLCASSSLLLSYNQGRLSNRSLISGGQMQIITQCLLSLPRYSALWVHTLFPSHSALWGRRECELSCNLHLAPKNNTALWLLLLRRPWL